MAIISTAIAAIVGILNFITIAALFSPGTGLPADQAFKLLLVFPQIQGILISSKGILLGFSGVLIGYQMRTLDTMSFELARRSGPQVEAASKKLEEFQSPFVNFATLYVIVALFGLLFGVGSLF